jgi:flavodoxin
MNKVLIVYFSLGGNTRKMAEDIAEGLRFSGTAVEVKTLTEIKTEKDLQGYNGYLFGCPTYHKDITENFKTFLFLAKKGNLEEKLGGAFGSHTHSGESPGIIYDTMENVFSMKMTGLGPFALKERVVQTDEGMRACQAYGRDFGKRLSAL